MNKETALKTLKLEVKVFDAIVNASPWGEIKEFETAHIEAINQVRELRKTLSSYDKCWAQLEQQRASNPLDILHQQAASSAQQVGDAIAQYDEKAKQGAVLAYQQLFNQELGAVLESGIVGQVADVEANLGESWLDMAKSRPRLLGHQPKSLPTSSANKSSEKS